MKLSELREQFKGTGWTFKRLLVPTLSKKIKLFEATRNGGLQSRTHIQFRTQTVDELFDAITGKNHSPECWAKTQELWRLRDEWVEKHPNYCKRCEGLGGFWSTYDPSASGISLSAGSMDDFDPCPECLDEGICPSCGQKMFNPEEYDGDVIKCPHCDWDSEHPNGMPQMSDDMCACEYEREKQYLESLDGAK